MFWTAAAEEAAEQRDELDLVRRERRRLLADERDHPHGARPREQRRREPAVKAELDEVLSSGYLTSLMSSR